jgi:hypothetical protein
MLIQKELGSKRSRDYYRDLQRISDDQLILKGLRTLPFVYLGLDPPVKNLVFRLFIIEVFLFNELEIRVIIG